MPPKGRSKAQTAPRPAEKPRDAVPQSASQPSTSGALPVVDPLLAEYPHVDALMLKVRTQAANSDIPSGASAAMGWLEEFSSKLQKIRENPMAEDVVLPPPTTARKTAPRRTAVRKTTTRKAGAERAEAMPSGAKRRTRAAEERARKLAGETQEIVVVDEVQVTEVIQIISEKIVVEEKTGEVEEEAKPVPAKRRTTRKKSSAVKQSPKLEAVEIVIPPEIVAEPSVVAEPPVFEAKPEEVSEAIVAEDHPLEAIEERPTAEGQTSLPSAQEEQVGDVSMHMVTPEPAEKPVEEAVGARTTAVDEKELMEVEQVSGQEEQQGEGQKVEPASAEVEDEWVLVDEKGDNTRLLEAFAVDGEKTRSQEEARPAEEVKRQRGSKEPFSKDKVLTVANEERSRAVALERMRVRDAERAKKAAEKREELERARQAKVEAHLLEKGKQEAVKKAKLGSTTQRQQEAERRRKEEVERYMKLAAKPPSEASPVRQTHYSGMKGASAAKAATPSKPSTLSLGDVQKTPPKLPTWQSATSTSTSKQSSQTVSHQPAKGFKQVPAGTKIFTPLQMPRVNVDGLRVAQKHVTDRAGSSQKTAVPLIPSLDSLRTHLTDSQHKASQPTANSNHSSSADGSSQESQRDRAMSPLMGLVKKPSSALRNAEKVKEGAAESDSLVRQTASMSLKDKEDVSMAEAPRQAAGLGQVDQDKNQETEAKKHIEVEKKDEVAKEPTLPVAAVRHKLISPPIISGGDSQEGTDQSLTAANSTFIHLPRSADEPGLSTTSDVQPKQPSIELTGSTFPTSAFQAAKSVFSNLTNPFSAFQSHSAKPEVTSTVHTKNFPVLPQEKEKPFSTFQIDKPTNNIIAQPSSSSTHLDTIKSTNPLSTFCQSDTVKAPSSSTTFSALSPKGEKLTFCNLQSSTFVSVSSKSHFEGAKAPPPFSTFHPEPHSNPSSNSSSNGFSAVVGPPTAVKVDMPSQKVLPTTSHKVASVVEVASSKPPEKHNSKKRPVEDVQTYGLDIQQDDDTDDEDNPRKVVPKWAESANLSALMRKQLCREIDLDMTFEGARPSEKVALGAIFQAPEARYNKRTSSQMWTHPPLALGVYTPHGHLKHVKEGLENIEDV